MRASYSAFGAGAGGKIAFSGKTFVCGNLVQVARKYRQKRTKALYLRLFLQQARLSADFRVNCLISRY
jgi:hypothetical protein